MSEISVLWRIFGAKRKEVTKGWKNLHEEERHNLYFSSIRVIKSKRMKWVEHVGRMEEMRNACTVLVRRPEGKNYLGDLDVDGRIVVLLK
jgi:hypothetical protein